MRFEPKIGIVLQAPNYRHMLPYIVGSYTGVDIINIIISYSYDEFDVFAGICPQDKVG